MTSVIQYYAVLLWGEEKGGKRGNKFKNSLIAGLNRLIADILV